VEHPKTKYVLVGDSDVAYQVVGGGAFDMLWVYPLGTHIDLVWSSPFQAKPFSLLAANGRLILLDRRGTGASGRLAVSASPTWEQLEEDVVAVLDAAGSTRTAIMSSLETGSIAILFAAMHPERVSALILIATTARYPQAPDYPIGVPYENAEAVLDLLAKTWGTEELAQLVYPSVEDDEILRQTALLNRASSTPREAVAQYRYFIWNVDVRDVLPLVRVPTLVIHPKDYAFIPVSHGRYLAEHIEGARFVEWPGADVGPDEEMMRLIVEFVTGVRPPVEADRILTTLLFTDIVRSTAHAASLGDLRWRSVLDSHDRAVREQLQRFRGTEINTTGDGFLASFDGPARAIRCGQEIVKAAPRLGVEVRVGIHSGECEARGSDLGGLAVHIGARIGAMAEAGEVLVSQMVKDLVAGSGIEFDDHGEHELKGVPGTWKVYAARD
jgi:class 3 adenylate cyclase